MGAISCLFQVIRTLYQPVSGNPLRLHGIGGYFEIMDLMKATEDDLFRFEIFQKQQPRGLFRVIQLGRASRLFPENVIYILEGLLKHRFLFSLL